MNITKGSLANGVLALMRISGLTVQGSPEDVVDCLQVMDDYAAELAGGGLDVGWSQPAEYGGSDPADISGLLPSCVGPFKKLMVPEFCSFYGKAIPQAVGITASSGMRALENLIVCVPDAQNPPTLPIGSGNEWDYRDRKFYSEPADNHDAGYVFKDDVLNYTHDFTQWLNGATLASVVWTVRDSGITLGIQTLADTTATVELTFAKVGGYELCATATKTGSTDKITERKNFIVQDCIQTGLVG